MNYRRLFIENSLIFITMVAYNRNAIFVDSIEEVIRCFNHVNEIYDFKVVAYSILPDHIHCIILPQNILQYPKIVKSFKYSFTKNVGLVKPTYHENKIKIWQNRYWEHTIRDEADLNKHIDYIHYNPVKHGFVKMAKDWEYSSFRNFVKDGFYDEDWCDFSKCEGLDCE